MLVVRASQLARSHCNLTAVVHQSVDNLTSGLHRAFTSAPATQMSCQERTVQSAWDVGSAVRRLVVAGMAMCWNYVGKTTRKL